MKIYMMKHEYMTNTIDIEGICVDCGRDTAFGGGLYVNRIPAYGQWFVNNSFEIQVDGYLCADCQCLDCSVCSASVIDYELIDNSVICENCLEARDE